MESCHSLETFSAVLSTMDRISVAQSSRHFWLKFHQRRDVLVDRGDKASFFRIHFATDTLFTSTPDLFKSSIGIFQGIIDPIYTFPDLLEDLILTIHLFHDLLMSSFNLLMV